jgi:hypothetical protein
MCISLAMLYQYIAMHGAKKPKTPHYISFHWHVIYVYFSPSKNESYVKVHSHPLESYILKGENQNTERKKYDPTSS